MPDWHIMSVSPCQSSPFFLNGQYRATRTRLSILCIILVAHESPKGQMAQFFTASCPPGSLYQDCGPGCILRMSLTPSACIISMEGQA